MKKTPSQACTLPLRGLDGTNPLGYLATLGTLLVARASGERDARLRWARARTWVPVLEGLSTSDEAVVSDIVARALRGSDIAADADPRRAAAEKSFKEARNAVKRRSDEIKRRRLGREQQRAAIESELRPVQAECDARRNVWLQALRDAVPRPELALGARIDCTDAEYREHADAFLATSGCAGRESLDLLAAFATDACRLERSDVVEPTPFCFIKGSGQQFFLDTVRQLITEVEPAGVQRTLFERWTYPDEKLSMRWDPSEDRRYALMDRDPTAADNKSRTMWMANLLAYRALAFFTCAPTRRGLGTTGWSTVDDEPVFTWPIWDWPACPDTIRSLLQLGELTRPDPDRTHLLARGVTASFRARRIRVPPTGSNYKLNFSPARTV